MKTMKHIIHKLKILLYTDLKAFNDRLVYIIKLVNYSRVKYIEKRTIDRVFTICIISVNRGTRTL